LKPLKSGLKSVLRGRIFILPIEAVGEASLARMKLYVCYGTFTAAPRPGGHPCGNAHKALVQAGHDPEVIKAYGFAPLPAALNNTRGRKEVKQLTGSFEVPVLVTDDGEVVKESSTIVEWAKAHPAGAGTAAA